MTKLFFIASPIAALGIYVLWRAVRGRPLSRFELNVVVALYLLVYVAVTAGLGIFWVARMDLPAFDLHYLFGYCVVLLVVVHVAFQLKILLAFARRVSPGVLLQRGGGGFRPAVRIAAGAIVAAALIAPLVAVLIGRAVRVPVMLHPALPPPEASSGAASAPPRIFIERGGQRIDAIDYMQEQSCYSRSGVVRSVPIVTRRPDEVKSYPEAPRVLLPAPRPRAGTSLGSALAGRAGRAEKRPPGEERIVTLPAPGLASMPLGALAEILHYSAGVTSRKAATAGLSLRAAASSGALFPTDVYVVARAVEGVEPGLYYYQPQDHALLKLRDGAAIDQVHGSLPAPESKAPVSFVLGVTFDRTVHKYNVRSYRYVVLDTGHLATNLGLSALAVGWPCSIQLNFDDGALARALSADVEQEGPLAVLSCDRLTPGRQEPAPSPAAEPIALPARADDAELTRLSHQLTSWKLTRGPPRPLSLPLLSTAGAPSLAEMAHAELDLFEAIASRRSYRDFAPDPLRLDELKAILWDSVELTPRLRGTRLVDLRLLVRAVDGLEPGLYRQGSGGQLALLAAGDRSAQIQSAGLSQELLGRAAVVLVWTLSAAVGANDGARDYRHACFEAGLAGENAYLSATARGIGICGVGAFYDDEVTALLESGGERPRALYLQGLGRR